MRFYVRGTRPRPVGFGYLRCPVTSLSQAAVTLVMSLEGSSLKIKAAAAAKLLHQQSIEERRHIKSSSMLRDRFPKPIWKAMKSFASQRGKGAWCYTGSWNLVGHGGCYLASRVETLIAIVSILSSALWKAIQYRHWYRHKTTVGMRCLEQIGLELGPTRSNAGPRLPSLLRPRSSLPSQHYHDPAHHSCPFSPFLLPHLLRVSSCFSS